MKNKYRILRSFAFCLPTYILTAGILARKDGYDFSLILISSVFGGGMVLATMLFSAIRDKKANKQAEVNQKDERTQLICGKAAVTAVYAVFCMLIILAICLFLFEKDVISYIIYGIAYAGLFIFEIRKGSLEEKM